MTANSDIITISLPCIMFSMNCELAFSRTSSPNRRAPFAADQPFAGRWPDRTCVITGQSWVTCSHLELICSQRPQVVHLCQALADICSLYSFLKKKRQEITSRTCCGTKGTAHPVIDIHSSSTHPDDDGKSGEVFVVHKTISVASQLKGVASFS